MMRMCYHLRIFLFLLISLSTCSEYTKYRTHTIDHGNIGLNTDLPLNIAHRGSSGVYPEHTVIAYETAVQDGADMIECDITITKDLKLVCRHKPWISDTTNVKKFKKYADREETYFIEGYNRTDWYTIDFTLQELLELKATQTIPIRDQTMNEQFPIATFDDFIQVAKSKDPPVGISIEIKTPAFINSLENFLPDGVQFEDIVYTEIVKHGYSKKDDGCIIYSFEENSLLHFHNSIESELPLVICVEELVDNTVIDRWVSNGFYGVCTWKDLIHRNYKDGTYKNYIFETTDFKERVHERGLKIHLFTFRNEDIYLGWDYGQDIFNEYDTFFYLNIEGYFTDFPGTLNKYMKLKYAQNVGCFRGEMENLTCEKPNAP